MGQEDDGKIDGVPPREGRTPIREWLEQKLPVLVSYPLESFRVHTVIRDDASSEIPTDKELIVIDIGESRLAPHQAAFPSDKPQYYYRQGGKSIAAPHHYLEALRNRVTFAVLESSLESVTVGKSHLDGDICQAVVEICLNFDIKNTSRVACYKWDMDVSLHWDIPETENLILMKSGYPKLTPGRQGILIDTTILPTRHASDASVFGFKFFGFEVCMEHIEKRLLPLEVHHYPIFENHLGGLKVTKLGDCADYTTIKKAFDKSLADAGIRL